MINNQTEEERAWWDAEMRRHDRIIAKGYWERLRTLIALCAVGIVVIAAVETCNDVSWTPAKVVPFDTAYWDSLHSEIPEAITSDTPSAEIQKVYDSSVKAQYGKGRGGK